MKLIKFLIFIILGVLLLQGCSLSFLNSDNDESDKPDYSEYVSATDTKYYYDGDDKLIWYETYDFNDLGQCIFIQHLLPSDTVLWSYVYEWSGDNVATEAYFNETNTLDWYNVFNYSSGNMVEQVYYNGSNQLQWFKAISYSGSEKEIQVARFNSSFSLEWAYKYEYDGSDRLLVSSAYGSNQNQTAAINYEYDIENRVIKKTGTGSTTNADTFSAAFSGFSFPTAGGINTEDRNTDSLATPSATATPAVPVLSLVSKVLNYEWMSLWTYTNFGYSFVTLNSDYLPVYMKTEAPDYLDDKPIEVDLTYNRYKVLTKTTSYNNQEILKLEFEYNLEGYLTSMDTTGVSLYIPLRYDFTYESGIPESISISNGSTLLQRFAYSYSVDINTINPEDYAESVHKISQYDGDNTYIGSYVFSYNNENGNLKQITITVLDSSDISNGHFLLSYDANDNTAGFTSYDKEGNKVWDYHYGYDELQNRISETRLDADDIPEVVYTFDVESIFEDLRRFLPLP